MGISGEVTFIAAYHYLRIFNSWVEAYEYKPNSSGEVEDPVLTGVPFNDAYRYWALALCPFLNVVYELLVGMAAATNSETDPMIKSMIQRAQYWTVVSWLTYPVVYIFPMIGFAGSHAVVAIQVGYCI